MKAAVFSGPGQPLTIQEIEKPVMQDGEMLVRVANCGICGTDIHASREGPFMAPPNTVFGHEFSGEIVEISAQAESSGFKIGDRITSLPFIGDKTIGLGDVTGAYAEFVRVGPESVVRLPDDLDDAQGALVEPLGIGLHAVKRAGDVAEKNILIIGSGPIGLACAVWCRFFGARSIVISEMSPARIEMAKTLGFADFVDPSGDVATEFQALADAEPDVQFECVGAPGLLQECINRAPRFGTIMAIGVCDNPDTIVPLVALTKEVTLRWAVAYEKQDFEFTIDMMRAGRIDAGAMITHVVRLEELPDIFEALRNPTDQCKVLIDLT